MRRGREWNSAPRQRRWRITLTLIAPYASELCNRRLSHRIQATTIELVGRILIRHRREMKTQLRIEFGAAKTKMADYADANRALRV
jgi:hypothetical protein